ncbi:MAG: hypothetical protein FWF90_18905 [Promicromonosporaceae bacterium]|nr:hypothetical protein [Promicromonosporaceae bacterium]
MPDDTRAESPLSQEELMKENRSLKRQLRNLETTLQRNKAMLAARVTVNSILESEQKLMDRNMSLLLENSADIILLFDKDGCFSYFTHTFLTVTGIAGSGLVSGKHFTEIFTDLVSKDWVDFIIANYRLALEQRITVRYQMKGMTPDETAGYIRHHIEQAGRTTDLFTDEAVTQIHQAARGKPRTVNNICTAALIATAGADKSLVDHASARAAIAEVTATD